MGLTRVVRSLGAVLAGLLLVLGAASAAHAHVGGSAELYVSGIRITPSGTAWRMEADVVDADSGNPAYGYEVTVTGTTPDGSSVRAVRLVDPQNTGTYAGTLTGPIGKWALTVTARDIPGGPIGITFTKTYHVKLTATGLSSSHSGFPWGVVAAVAGAVLLLLAAVVALRRRKPRVGQAKANEVGGLAR